MVSGFMGQNRIDLKSGSWWFGLAVADSTEGENLSRDERDEDESSFDSGLQSGRAGDSMVSKRLIQANDESSHLAKLSSCTRPSRSESRDQRVAGACR